MGHRPDDEVIGRVGDTPFVNPEAATLPEEIDASIGLLHETVKQGVQCGDATLTGGSFAEYPGA